ncbi:MAG: Trypsin [Pseudomonadota bacterium]|jgi:V8-like Glu-specific endopeptidase
MGFSLDRAVRILALMTILPVWGCHPMLTTKGSDLKIDSGTSITAQSKNRVPAVHWLGNCTGTAVSHNTLLYAAHCTGSGTPEGSMGRMPDQVCINKNLANPDNPSVGACSTSLFVHPGYINTNYRYDVAIGVFPDNTFKNYFPLQMEAPRRGAKVFLVGYSSENMPDTGVGAKRWGYNTIARMDDDDAIISNYGSSASNVAVSPGDSGGPLFHDCKVLGVASRMSTEGQKFSLHTNLTLSKTRSWMQELVKGGGANICGLSETDQAHCLATAVGGWDSELRGKDQVQEFPCAPSSVTVPDNGTNPVSVLLSKTSGDALEIYVGSTRLEGTSASICAGKSQCTGPETAIALAERRDQSVIFGPAIWPASPGQEITVLIRDASGSVIATRSLRLIRKS